MRIPMIFAVAAAGVLSACSGVDPQPGDAAQSSERAETFIRYACEDGTTIKARYPTTETARIIHEGRTIDLSIARSASGARYIGDGWQWWTKGGTQGWLAPLRPGEEIASASGLACAASPEQPGS